MNEQARVHEAANREEFQRAAESYRRELQVHCYRILGSIHEAEDAVQESMLRAWRSIDSFEGRSTLRSWLYRITTNVCLNVIEKRSHARPSLPALHGSPALQLPSETPTTEIAWLEPYPDAELEGIVDTQPGPHARYEQREAMQLAFIAAIQYLPGRQRAALLLHDVVGWSAAETATILDMSPAAVNSALQRARATLKKHGSGGRSDRAAATESQRALLDRYVRAWETKNLESLMTLLKEDAVMSMPPVSEWYQGRDAIRALFAWAWATMPYSAYRMVATEANGQPAFAMYAQNKSDSKWHAHAIHVVELKGDSIVTITNFLNPELFRTFGLSATIRG